MNLQDIILNSSKLPRLVVFAGGKTFNLIDDVAIVIDGVVSVIIPDDSPNPATIRVLGAGDVVNVELILNPTTAMQRQYVCDSDSCTIATIKADEIRRILNDKSTDVRYEFCFIVRLRGNYRCLMRIFSILLVL